jgi:hypothetical protein
MLSDRLLHRRWDVDLIAVPAGSPQFNDPNIIAVSEEAEMLLVQKRERREK